METVAELLAFAGAIGSSFALGAVKKHTTALDKKVGNVVKPIQPLLVLAGSLALPAIGGWLGIVPPDAAQFIDAPTATVATIAAREALARFRRKAY